MQLIIHNIATNTAYSTLGVVDNTVLQPLFNVRKSFLDEYFLLSLCFQTIYHYRMIV